MESRARQAACEIYPSMSMERRLDATLSLEQRRDRAEKIIDGIYVNGQLGYVTLRDAIIRSGLDMSPCITCGEQVVCIPDGTPMCEPCAESENQ